MRQRSQIARSAKRTFLENYRQDIIVEKINKAFNKLQAYTRISLCKRIDFNEQHQPHYVISHCITRTACMRADKVMLQRLNLQRRYGNMMQSAKAGVDSVNRGRIT